VKGSYIVEKNGKKYLIERVFDELCNRNLWYLYESEDGNLFPVRYGDLLGRFDTMREAKEHAR